MFQGHGSCRRRDQWWSVLSEVVVVSVVGEISGGRCCLRWPATC
jgi:hypothetical protein